MLHLYKDAALTQRISEGDLSNPDDDIYNGTDGESKDKQLFLANEQTTLAAAIGVAATTVQLAAARFSNLSVIIVDSEQMRVISGGGTTTLTVTRGYNGTTAASHIAGTAIYTAAQYNSLTVEPIDTADTSETTWYRLAASQAGLDTAVAGAAHSIGSKAHNATLSFWRRVTVPAGTAIQNKTDLKLRITGWENAV